MLIQPLARRIATATSRRANRVITGSFKTVTRLRSVLSNLARRVNGDRLTAAAFLTSIGADDDTIRRFASQVGKHATKLMREQGIEPKHNGLAVIVRHHHAALVEVNTYPRDVLAAAVRQYPRTSSLIGA